MGVRVLIVEDDLVVRQLLEWRLGTMGYTVCGKATTAEDAFSEVKTRQPDVVLMDIHLNGRMDGIDAAHAIKKMHNIPVIFITAHFADDELARVKAIRPDGYILKPFNDTDLRVALELACGVPGSGQTDPAG
ncbi:response regulator [Methanoregula sp.]|uniref:response regulator n=1 Tax=Methanoregula sp. TaxID=2052170 RepID=UPI002BEA7AFF|nr:response regulator [Methanoregula sp.]HVP96959.1 response regulator [Methanoregula sp.]